MFVNEKLSIFAKQRKKILYLGLDPSRYVCEAKLVHYPMIRIEPKALSSECKAAYKRATDLVVTSRQTVLALLQEGVFDRSKRCLSIGEATTALLKENGCTQILTAKSEQAEGVISLLKRLDLQERFVFYPHSALARDLIATFLKQSKLAHCECVLYDTVFQALEPLPDLTLFDEIVFTSPSTVEAFCATFSSLPKNIYLTAFGPITEKKLLSKKRLLSYLHVQKPSKRIGK